MHKGIKRILAFCTLVITACMVTACRQKPATNTKKVTIEYFNQKKETANVTKGIIKDFEKKNPDIHVKEVDVPNANIVLKTRILSGDEPDVINIYPQNIDFQEWAKAGYFADMTHEPYIKNIKDNYADQFKINGKVYSAPLSANVYGFFYNKTEFKKLGLKVPTTWKDFELLTEQLKAAHKTPFAIAGTEPWTLNGYHQLALATITGSGANANKLLRFSKPNGINVNNKYIQEDFNRLNLLRFNSQNNWQGASYNDAMVAFANGSAMMTPNGSWALPVIMQQKPKFEIGTFAFPAARAGKEMVAGSGDLALSISAHSKHKEAAERFVAYMTTPAAMQKFYNVDGSPVAVKGVKQKGPNSALWGISKYAFTKHDMVWLSQNWNSENDFFNLTANYLMTGNKQQMVDQMNTFFNPMKASN